jgi:hypothetical protein
MLFRVMVAGCLCFCLSGCGDSKPAPDASVTVTGIVTMDGKPLEKARVVFIPLQGAEQGNGGSGLTDSAGKYELRSLVGEESVVGTPPGKYRVVISKMIKPDGSVAPPDEPPIMSAASESIPLRYSDFSGSKLDATVATSGGTFNFDLTSK